MGEVFGGKSMKTGQIEFSFRLHWRCPPARAAPGLMKASAIREAVLPCPVRHWPEAFLFEHPLLDVSDCFNENWISP
jgi:hypothetical protein